MYDVNKWGMPTKQRPCGPCAIQKEKAAGQAMTKQSPGGEVLLCELCGELGFVCSFAMSAG